MKLNDLIYAFKNDYELQCEFRGIKPIALRHKQLALILSKIVSDLQKKLGVIEASYTASSINGTASYSISASFMTPQTILYDGYPLKKKSMQWIKEQYAQSGSPMYYAIQYTDRTAKLYLYPTPDTSGDDNIVIQCKYNYNLYSPSDSSQDFGTFTSGAFSSDTVLPSQYDQALLLGMMKEIFPDYKPQYLEEVSLLRVKQYNGEGLTYDFGGEKEVKDGLQFNRGVTELNMDEAEKYARFEFTYGAVAQTDLKYQRGWTVTPTVSDSGTVITITSSQAEFNSSTKVECNNANVDINRTSTSVITVNYFGNTFTKITCQIWVWVD